MTGVQTCALPILNTADSDIYDLTRMQSQAYWSTNHFLMRIWDDLDEEDRADIQFVTGEKERADYWNTDVGIAEFERNVIYLTSLPKGRGVLSLKGSDTYKDVEVSATLTGNYCGEQTIYLRGREDTDEKIGITVCEKELIVSQSGKELARVDLDELMQVEYLSVEEDQRDALAKEYEVRADNAGSLEESLAYDLEKSRIRKTEAAAVEDGAEPYIPVIESNQAGKWDMLIKLQDNKLSVMVNEKVALDGLEVTVTDAGKVILEANNLEEEQYRQRNLTDDVYEARFEDLVIRDLSQEKTVTLYDNRIHGLDKAKYSIADVWTKIVNWFIENL